MQVRSTLRSYESYICAPVMVTGPLTVVGLSGTPDKEEQNNNTSKGDQLGEARNRTSGHYRTRGKREDKQIVGTAWDKFVSNNEVTILWNQEPIGVPSFKAISEGRIITGQVLGTMFAPIIGPMINPQYTARNSRWINNLWYTC